jgi:hypothetical protein
MGGIEGAIGPFQDSNRDNGGAGVTFSGGSTAIITQGTAAFIARKTAPAGGSWAVGFSADYNNARTFDLAFSFGPNGDIALFIGGTGYSTGIALTDGVPYFVAASYSGAAAEINWATTNLLTGSRCSGVMTGVSTPNTAAASGVYCVGDNGNGWHYSSNAAAMYSSAFVPLRDLEGWGADPWSFWYPERTTFAPIVGQSASNDNAVLSDTLGALTASATAQAVAAGTAAPTLAPLSVSAAGAVVDNAVGSPALAALTSSGAAKDIVQASVASTLTPLASSGAAAAIENAVVSAILAPLTVVATVSDTPGLIVDSALDALTIAATANVLDKASASGFLNALISSTSVDVIVTVTDPDVLDSLTAAAAAVIVVDSGSAPTLAPLTVTAALRHVSGRRSEPAVLMF